MVKVSRKQFIQISSGAVVLSSLWGLGGCTDPTPPSKRWQQFDHRSVELLRGIWQALVGKEFLDASFGEEDADQILVECAGILDRLLQQFSIDSSYIVDDFRLGLKVLDYGPIALGWYGRTFSSLDLTQRQQILKEWSVSQLQPLRELSYGFKGLFTLIFYEHPAVQTHIGFDQPWVPRERIEGARLEL